LSEAPNRGQLKSGSSGIFAQARAARLGENTKFPLYSHMQKPKIFAQINHKPNYIVQAPIQHSNMQSKVIKTYFYAKFKKKASFPYLFTEFVLG